MCKTVANQLLEARLRTGISFSVFVFVALLGCSRGAEPHIARLPSGKAIKVVGMGPIRIASGETGLMLRYQTDLKITDLDNLRKEVDEIWPVFQVDVDRAQVSFAVISASEVPEGTLVRTNRQYNFVYQKAPDGSWHSVEKKERQP
jgi:hypothetical protein